MYWVLAYQSFPPATAARFSDDTPYSKSSEQIVGLKEKEPVGGGMLIGGSQ